LGTQVDDYWPFYSDICGYKAFGEPAPATAALEGYLARILPIQKGE